MNWNIANIIERGLWTFLQAAIGALPVTISLTKSDLKAVGLAALAAGIAALVSFCKNLTAEGVAVSAAKKAAGA